MELINIEQLMRDKLNECDAWLVGRDDAVRELAVAREAYLKAEEKVAEYTDENICAVVAYRDDLKVRLGIVDEKEEVEEVVEEVKEEVKEEEPIVRPTPVVEEVITDEIVETPIIAQ